MRRVALLCAMAAMGAMVVGLAAGCEPKKSPAPGAGAPATPAKTAEPPAAATSQLVLPQAGASAAVTEKNFVTDWLVLGPFQFKETDFGGDQQQAATTNAFVPGEANLDGSQPAPAGTSWRAQHFTGAEAGRIDLDALYNGIDHAAVYAVAWLYCPEQIRDARLLVGSDDYLMVWVNGKLVHTYKTERRAGVADQDVVSGVTLKKGYNRIVVKCVDVVLAWDFYFRVADSKGAPIVVTKKGP